MFSWKERFSDKTGKLEDFRFLLIFLTVLKNLSYEFRDCDLSEKLENVSLVLGLKKKSFLLKS
jgi:hypothetical protein